jgi:UDP-N-acetylglucosamine 2-epimerase (non-hydrolysing)
LISNIVVVQGDTISTLIGAIYTKLNRKKLIHVEAGIRSKNLMHPFPEEITRKFVSKLTNWHFVPSIKELMNLKSEGVMEKTIVETYFNTAIDNLKNLQHKGVSEKLVIVSLHRTELLYNKHLLRETFHEIFMIDKKFKILIITDKKTKYFMEKAKIVIPEDVNLLLPLDHEKFINKVNHCEFIITDSGGLVQEVEFLGIPTLVHRKVIESKSHDKHDNENLVLSNLDPIILRDFIHNYEIYRRDKKHINISPSEIIAKRLLKILQN